MDEVEHREQRVVLFFVHETFPTSEWTPIKLAMQQAAAAIRDKEIPAPIVNVNVPVSVSVRSYEVARTVIGRAGRVTAV